MSEPVVTDPAHGETAVRLAGKASRPRRIVFPCAPPTGSAGDFRLLRLDQAPPAGATFLGWKNTPIASTNGANLYRISNPNFGPQGYSQHDVDQTGATMGGSCQSGSDPCPGQGCDEGSDLCVTCGGNKDACTNDGDCCSYNCRNGSCRGN